MAVVVLGAGGRLGRLLAPRWSDGVRWLSRADVDVLDAEAVGRALAGASAGLCMAGVTNGTDRSMALNVTLAQATLDAAAKAQAGRVFLFSSAAVYGAQGGLLSEQGPTAAVSDYGRAKIEMEKMAAAHPHPATVLRLGNVAGADAILDRWRPGFALDTFEDGTTPKRSYIGPGMLANALRALAAQQDLPGLLNLCAPGCVEMGALLDAAGLAWARRPATDATIAEVWLDTRALEAIIEFTPADRTPAGIVADWQRGLDT